MDNEFMHITCRSYCCGVAVLKLNYPEFQIQPCCLSGDVCVCHYHFKRRTSICFVLKSLIYQKLLEPIMNLATDVQNCK